MRTLFIFIISIAAGLLPASGAEKWVSLWDGKTFNGWHIIGKGNWEIKDGAIHGTHSKTEKQFGHLVTDRTFTNFTARLKYKVVTGNSGFYFRIEEKGHSGVTGFQAEIDSAKDGGLYETNLRGWVVEPAVNDAKKWLKPGEWNEMTVNANGGNIVVTVNGIKTAELKNDKGRADGKLALQLHANQDGDIWFKEIEVLADDTNTLGF
jgi:hypothetical protein